MARETPSRSLSKNLSAWLAIQTSIGLTFFSIATFLVIGTHLSSRQKDSMFEKQVLVHHLVKRSGQTGDINELREKLDDFLAGHHELVIELMDSSNRIVYESEDNRPDSDFAQITTFSIPSPHSDDGNYVAEIKHDGIADGELLYRLAITLASFSILSTLVVSIGAYWLVKRGLKPVDDLAQQTATLTASSLPSDLDGSAQPKELQPLVTQFNYLLERLSLSYRQLEHFNADVAHELNTPLTTLVTSTELVLRNLNDPDNFREILGSNLEELQRMSGIVKDMLFLSRAERGNRARCEYVRSLASIAANVVDYHEAFLLEENLKAIISGDVSGEFDVPLIKRAVSNLLANAADYALPGSAIKIKIGELDSDLISISVINKGSEIPNCELGRIFDRFFRLDDSRSRSEIHHGLGLSIVSGIARMHGGAPFARSNGNATEVGIKLPKMDKSSLTTL